MPYENIICPFCFETFNHDEVLFRAETFFTEEDIEDIDDIQSMDDGLDKIRAMEEYKKKSKFLAGEHPSYTHFWEPFQGTTELTRKSSARRSAVSIENYQKPIISPRDSDVVRFNNANKNGVRFDNDGFLSSIDDVYGRHSSSRVCPHCCNPIPANYGKFPVKFISIIGIKNAGKTVYLSSLFDNMNDYAAKIGMVPLPSESVSFFISNNKIAKGKVLPQSTPPWKMSQPLCYNLQYLTTEGKRETSTFVIYDIAGENCESTEDVQAFGSFIEHSDGIIILQDPSQFKDLNTEAHQMVDSVISTINKLFVGKEYCDIPLALCISKSDTLMDLFDDTLKSLLQEPVRSAEGFKGFCAKDYNEISKLIDDFYRVQDYPTRNALKTSFDNFNYFAISSLNCELEDSGETDSDGKKTLYPAEKPNPMRIEEPIYWMFDQFGFIKSDEKIIRHGIQSELENYNKIIEAKRHEKDNVTGITKGIRERKQKAIQAEIDVLLGKIQSLMSS